MPKNQSSRVCHKVAKIANNKLGIKICSSLSTGVSSESGYSADEGKQSNGL